MPGYPQVIPGLLERSAAEPGMDGAAPVGTAPLEPPRGGSGHCSQVGKTGVWEALPKLTENTLLRKTFLLKFVHENALNSLDLSSLKE